MKEEITCLLSILPVILLRQKKMKTSVPRQVGRKISAYFSPEIQINNQAKNGRSTKSFIQEGRLARLASQFQPNDFLFVQFGHNDQKIQEERGTLPSVAI